MTERNPPDGDWMERCRELARQAAALGNTPVGSLVVLADAVIAEAAEAVPRGDRAFAHAELLAVEAALRRYDRKALAAATLYSTAEPCILCSFAIREAHIGRVVIGRSSGEIGGVRGRLTVLSEERVARWGPRPEVVWWKDGE